MRNDGIIATQRNKYGYTEINEWEKNERQTKTLLFISHRVIVRGGDKHPIKVAITRERGDEIERERQRERKRLNNTSGNPRR